MTTTPAASDALGRLLSPTRLVVVGAAADPMTITGRVLDSARRFGWTGEVFPVTGQHSEIAGYPCYPSLDALPPDARPDAALLGVAAEDVLNAAQSCARLGVRAVTVVAGGFAEAGGAGADRQADLQRLAAERGLAVCGPNCLGAASFADGYPGFGGTALAEMDSLRPGRLALVCQSGGLANALVGIANSRGTHFSHVISSGNEAVTRAHDYLGRLASDDRVAAVLSYLEQIRDPERFFAAARRCRAAGKPVVVLRGASSDAAKRAVSSHTAALAGEAAVVEAALRQVGAVQIGDVDELLDAGDLLALVPALPAYRIGVFSQIGGGAAIAADYLSRHGFVLPDLADGTVKALTGLVSPLARIGNPIDPIGGFARKRDRFRAGLSAFVSDPGLDLVLFVSVAGHSGYANDLAEDIGTVARESGKPVVCAWLASEPIVHDVSATLRRYGVMTYPTIGRAARAIAAHRSAYRQGPGRDEPRTLTVRSQQARSVDPIEALTRRAVRFPERLVTDDACAAVEFGERHHSVAVKINLEGVTHKTELSGVRLGLRTPEEIEAAATELLAIAASLGHTPRIEVQAMAPPGVELLVGVRRDPELGPSLCLGAGGVTTEILADATLRLLPVSRDEITEMLGELRMRPLLEGFRGFPPADLAALVDTVIAVIDTVAATEFAVDIEMNPVIVHPQGQGCTVVDIVVTAAN